jgi:hypothetical protein
MAAPRTLPPERTAAQHCLDAYAVLDSGSEPEFDDLALVREKYLCASARSERALR